MNHNKFFLYTVIITVFYSLLSTELNYFDAGYSNTTTVLTIGYIVALSYSLISKYKIKINFTYAVCVIYAVLVIISCLIVPSKEPTMACIIKNTMWCLCFWGAYRYGYGGNNLDKIVKSLQYFILPVFYILYIYILSNTYFMGEESGFRDAIFPVVSLFPYVLLSKSKKVIIFHIVFLAVLVIFSSKRSLIVGFTMAFFAYFSLLALRNKEHSKMKLAFIGITLFVVANYVVNMEIFEISFSRFEDFQDDQGNGRNYLYSTIIEKFGISSSWEQLVGHGTASTKLIVEKLAHNDLLQVLYDYGLMSFVPFVCMYFSLLFILPKLHKIRNDYYEEHITYLILLILYYFIGMFNCYISYPSVYCVTMFLFGYLIGKNRYNRKSLQRLSNNR